MGNHVYLHWHMAMQELLPILHSTLVLIEESLMGDLLARPLHIKVAKCEKPSCHIRMMSYPNNK